MKIRPLLASIVLVGLLSGCAGFDFPPSIYDFKPFALLTGDQIGRDKIGNRHLVAQKRIGINGRSSNEILTMLGQPQVIEIHEKDVSEDWYFQYYPRLAKAPTGDQATFVVRLYHQKVIDVINLNT